MTANETMLALHKLIGGVKWEEEHWRFTLTPASDDYQCGDDRYWWKTMIDKYGDHVVEMTSWFGYEAQALIKDAAIEWLDGQVECLAMKRLYPGGHGRLWVIGWWSDHLHRHCEAKGKTLLDALHAAVKAAKESQHAQQGRTEPEDPITSTDDPPACCES